MVAVVHEQPIGRKNMHCWAALAAIATFGPAATAAARSLAVPGILLAAIEEQNVPKTKREEAPPPVPKLTRPPELTEFVSATYPAELLASGTRGEVVLYIDITADGGVDKVEVVSSSDPAFAAPAMSAATKFRFIPAEIDFKPAAIRIEYRYVFEPEEIIPDAIAGEPSILESELLPVTFTGLVREAGNRKPVAAAVISINGAPVTETDADGRFDIRRAPGKLQVRVTTPYHQTYETDEVIGQDEQLQAKYYLVIKSTNPFEVVVRTRAERREVAKIQLQRQELEKVPGTFGDPVRVIENLPGMGRTPGGLGGALLVRGDRPSSTSVYLDGVDIPLLYHFGGLTSIINSQFLESIDFYPGGFGARYGEATAGVVEVHSRDLDCNMVRGAAKVDFIDASAYSCVPVGDWHIAAAARRSYVDLLIGAVLNSLPREEGEGSLTAAPYYWDYQIKAATVIDDHKIDLFAFGTDDQFKVIQTGSAESININFKLHLGTHRFLARDRWRLRDKMTLTSQIAPGFQLQNLSSEYAELDASTEFGTNIYTIDWREDFTFEATDWLTLRAGIDHRFGTAALNVVATIPTDLVRFPRPTFDYTNTEEFGRDLSRYNHAYWLELELKPLESLRIVPGLRVERWDFYKSQKLSIMPRATVRWQFEEDMAIKVAYGLYEKLPEPNYLIDGTGNPGLAPERAHHFIGGYEYKITELIDLDLQGFYNLRSNIPTQSAAVRYENGREIRQNFDSAGEGYTYGMEILLRQLATADSNFYGWIAYTLSKSRRRDRATGLFQGGSFGDEPDKETQEYPSNFDQTHILTVVGQWVLPWGLEAGFRFRLVSGNPYTPRDAGIVYWDADRDTYRIDNSNVQRNSERMPMFHQLDVRVDKTWTYDLWKLTAYLEIINVYYQKNVEQYQYSYDYDKRVPLTLLPILPVLGLKGEF